MNSNNLIQLLQTGFHASLGATTAFVETLQDPQKREERISQLRLQLSEQLAEWVQKGEITEQEARIFIERLLRQQGTGTPTTPTTSDTVETAPTTPVASPNVQLEIEELTAQIAAIRTELENLRNPGSTT